MTTADSAAEQAQARDYYQVPDASTVADAVRLLKSWGAEPMPVGTQEGSFFDEYVEEDLVVFQARITDQEFISAHITALEVEGFGDGDESDDDPEDESGIVVILERSRDDATKVGNFRVHGPGQWVREALWAATGVVPRDPVDATSDLYRRAVEAEHPGRWDAPVPMYLRLGRFWPRYVAFMRPRWRRARRSYLADRA
ncbi:hypothetical protein [Kineosporia babensis]|uniref:Uncharacterized protein n=1 Tax=Kineosporia babensis TaxID=499548 RepID=A0A9X1NL90_9ACTN|nr:hypothetical protein [Kineosporia babensis]MCD5315781.1 hypothetical protein [Kineosporia babensis]